MSDFNDWIIPGGGGSGITLSDVPDAAVGTKGITRLSSAPAVAATPIAVGDNDTRMLAGFPHAAYADYIYNGSQFLRENISRRNAADVGNLASALTSGVMTLVPVPVIAGDILATATWHSGNTGSASISNLWSAIYDSAATPNLLRQSTDTGATTWSANSTKVFTFATSYTVPANGYVWCALMLTGTVTPLSGWTSGKQFITTGSGGQITSAATGGSSLTTTAPNTVTLTAAASIPYVYIK